jgi:putative hydrolase of the HAD superfamily
MGHSGKIEAVTFDVGATLIEPWPSVGHVYAEVAAKHGAGNLSPEILNRRFAAAWKAHPGFDYAFEDWSAIVDATFAGLIADKPSETFFHELFERFARADAWRIFDDVPPTLSALAGHGVRLGVISNWDDRLRPLLNSLGLARKFETIVVSCELGAGKPAAAPFEAAAKAFGLPPAQILHVGDSADTDVAGARAAGFQAVQIVRGDSSSIKDQITCLRDLVVLASTANGVR